MTERATTYFFSNLIQQKFLQYHMVTYDGPVQFCLVCPLEHKQGLK